MSIDTHTHTPNWKMLTFSSRKSPARLLAHFMTQRLVWYVGVRPFLFTRWAAAVSFLLCAVGCRHFTRLAPVTPNERSHMLSRFPPQD